MPQNQNERLFGISLHSQTVPVKLVKNDHLPINSVNIEQYESFDYADSSFSFASWGRGKGGVLSPPPPEWSGHVPA